MANSRIYLEKLGFLVGDTFTPQNPLSISAVVKDESGNVIEKPTPINESTGQYYVELDDSLYTVGNIYNVHWTVQMISGIDQQITTRFYYNATVYHSSTTGIYVKTRNSGRYKLYRRW